MRTALYPSLVKAAQAHAKGDRVLIFEMGRIFPTSGETERVGLLMRGPLAPRTDQAGIAGDFRAFKGLVESLAGTLGASFELRQLRGEAVPAALHPGIAGEVVWNGQSVGWLGALHPEIAQAFGLKGDTFLMEAALPLPGREWAFRDPSRAPAAWRDLAVITPQASATARSPPCCANTAAPCSKAWNPSTCSPASRSAQATAPSPCASSSAATGPSPTPRWTPSWTPS